jgi:hypothetical protein
MHLGADASQRRLLPLSDQAVTRQQLAAMASHAFPALDRLLGIDWLSKHLTLENKHRIASEHSCDLGINGGF